jgi:pyrroloquinoline quinone biosynthesis protein B
VRAGSPTLRARTQKSVAISADGAPWFLISASPEIRAQIDSFEGLWPRAERHSPIHIEGAGVEVAADGLEI